MQAQVYYKNKFAGILSKIDSGFSFVYDDSFLSDSDSKSISLTLPKQKKEFQSQYLFPFFHGLLTEGFASQIQSRKLKIDENDYFKRLIETANNDTIGCVTIGENK
ncbi:MAG: HipA N-terminal domain-containing protein [Candidatus Cloacimonetes bacterium]|nr:HipA N-terminal domain-containing protein [Candidatus Cloacimonadota bacterium]MCF7813422.1 HipA N-terminal domain-containing protein [Candidatus Cloacimonadota bacterium]MCF7867715.1 HipA N-terminal domain-containing protein [Candidatus Cloacimonadota bacterium]MCF7883199.1 HipA N-terminal domain-containing protein [Candidatus Cloacimonadota bacterium]